MAVRVKTEKATEFKQHYSTRVCETCTLDFGKSWWTGEVTWNSEKYIVREAKVAKLKAPFVRGCVKARDELHAALAPVAERMNVELAKTGTRPDTGDVVWPEVAKRWKRAEKRKATKAATAAAAALAA